MGTVRLLNSTDKAVLVELESGDELWVPNSVIHDDSEIYVGVQQGEVGELYVHDWWARTKGYA